MAAPVALAFRIAANLGELRANLAEAKTQLETTKQAMQKMANSLDGSRLVADANAMVKAVADIGGATRLTDAEQKRVNATVTEALAKYGALGREAPADLRALAEATRATEKNTEGWASQLVGVKSLLGGLGIGLSVGAVVQFGKAVFDSAGRINDLSQAMGVSTDAVQGFKFAAEQSGGTLDDVGTAISKMNDNLAEGGKGTVAALQKAGLGFQQIRAMKPEDAFLAITDAVQQIPDPMDQTQVAMDLFGKSAASILPAIKAGFRGVSDEADKMSEETIKALDDAGDAWARLGNKVTIVTGEIIVGIEKGITGMVDGVKNITSSVGSFAVFAENAMKMGVGPALAMSGAWEQANKAGQAHKDVLLALPPPLKKTKEETDAAAASAKKYAEELAKYSGAAATAQLKTLDKVFRDLSASGKLTQEGLAALTKDAVSLFEAGGKLPPVLQQMVIESGKLSPSLSTAALSARQLGTEFELALPKMVAVQKEIAELQAKTHGGIAAGSQIGQLIGVGAPKIEKSMFGADFGKSIASSILSAVQGGGNPIGAIGSTLGSTMLGGLAKTLTSGAGVAITGALGGAINAILPGLGALLGPLMSKAWDGLKSLFGGGSKGRDLVKDWIAQNFGNSSELQRQLLELGPEYDRLWRGVTQLGDNASTQEARAKIDAVTQALEAHKQKVAEDAAVTQKAAAEISTQQQAAVDVATSQLAALDQQIKSLQDSIAGEAPEEVMGIVEAQARAQIAALQEQRAVAAATLETLNKNTADSLSEVADAIKNLPDEIKVRVKIDYEKGGFTGREDVPQYASGGFVDTPRMAVVGDSPEYITPRQSIGQLARELAAAGGSGRSGGSRMLQPISIQMGTRVLWDGLIETADAEGLT